jgi:fructosamine-3-kinase
LNHLQEALLELGDTTVIREVKSISGGSINQITYVQTDKKEYILKAHSNVPKNFFIQEALGLSALSCCVRVPQVYNFQFEETTSEGQLWLEWIPTGQICEKAEEERGRKLAQLHQSTHTSYGFIEDNYLGIFPQPNTWSDDWVSFFRDNRLQVQKEISEQKGLLHSKRREKIEKLFARLDDFLPNKPISSLLHGDMWSGNSFVDTSGVPVFIDPAVSYGDREVDLAMTELFGGFSARFYDAYQEIIPLDEAYHDRKSIYQLYYLLIHLNYYGESYGIQIDEIVDRYV